MYEDHLKTCEYCQKGSQTQTHKPTIFIKLASSYSKYKKPIISVKSASSYGKQRKLSELGAIIRGTSYAGLSPWLQTKTKGASEVVRKPGPIEKRLTLRNLEK